MIVDYAWGYHPGHAKALAKAGVTGVLRYCSRDPNKDISSFEVKELKAAGIQIGLVYETSADWMLGGYARGVTAGTEALLRAKKAGLTPGILYLGADFDVSAAQQSNIDDAIRGGNTVVSCGIYGGYNTVKRALDSGATVHAWQTSAWSHNLWDQRAVLQQYSNGHIISGLAVDYNRAVSTNWGQWVGGGVHSSPPKPPTAPSSKTFVVPGKLDEPISLRAIARFLLPAGASDNAVQTELERLVHANPGLQNKTIALGGHLLNRPVDPPKSETPPAVTVSGGVSSVVNPSPSPLPQYYYSLAGGNITYQQQHLQPHMVGASLTSPASTAGSSVKKNYLPALVVLAAAIAWLVYMNKNKKSSSSKIS